MAASYGEISDNKRQAERDVQKNYWIEHSADLTVEAMMLDSRAADLDKEERPELAALVRSQSQKTPSPQISLCELQYKHSAEKRSHIRTIHLSENEKDLIKKLAALVRSQSQKTPSPQISLCELQYKHSAEKRSHIRTIHLSENEKDLIK
ncbi:hypothetical protein F2Q68_00017438 [Brassica cretica]|uniref:Uncharacterized protein n=1 Tax=Brassica cretica TaxID=69181 RepID=A0A8S9HGF1_BRACR|nr:hypothetical protein F2Q68_00017438 [Brassica cretica]